MLTVAVQAGGESRRMGRDKALLPFLGRPLIARVIDRLRPIADELLVTTNRPDAYRFLDVRLVPDLRPGRGALGGLYTALSAARHPFVAVVACDMPFVSAALIERARTLLVQSDADVVVPSSGEHLEPLHAVYRRATCLPAVEAALDAGAWKMISWFTQVRVHVLSPDEVRRYDATGLAFWNVNTPEEFAAAERRARSLADDEDGA